jgi:perosamine synthetase
MLKKPKANDFAQELAKLNSSARTFPLHETKFLEDAVGDVSKAILDGNVSALGPELGIFENGISKIVGSTFAVGVASGTAALHLSLHALQIGEGDEVIVPTCTFVATVNAVIYTGASPVFIDSEEDALGLDPTQLREFLLMECLPSNGFTFNKKTGRKVSAVIPMHVLGHPARSHEIRTICDEFNLFMIEDAAESLGSTILDEHTGILGDVGILSFNGNKILTTGNGGAVVTNNQALAEKIRHLASTAKVAHAWEFQHDQLGWNYRLPNINAALGISQLRSFQETLDLKKSVAQIYREVASNIDGVSFIETRQGTQSNYWLCSIRFSGFSTVERNDEIGKLREVGFMARPLWNLMHELPFLKHHQHMPIKNAKRHLAEVVCLPSSSYLAKELSR